MAEYTDRIEKKFGAISDRLDLIAEQKNNDRADRLRMQAKVAENNQSRIKDEPEKDKAKKNRAHGAKLEVEEPPERKKFDELLRSF